MRIGLVGAGLVLGVGLTAALSSSAEPGAARTTIPYSGYVDFDGQPVNAGSVKFNFALFDCPDTSVCDPLWVAKGVWDDGFQAGQSLTLPIFAGRFTVELGADGQNVVPDAILDNADPLYLAISLEGRTLANLQKIAPTPRAVSAFESSRFTVHEALEVEGDTTLAGAVTLNDTLHVTGAARFAAPVQLAPSVATITCDASSAGTLYFDATRKTFVGCDGAHLQPFAPGIPVTCLALKRSVPTAPSGVYVIDPDGNGGRDPFSVYCDQDTDGGGWTVFQRNSGNTTFDQDWATYAAGFGDLTANHWLGNDRIADLSNRFKCDLRVDLRLRGQTQFYYAKYSSFAVANASEQYRLTAGGYSGTAGDGLYDQTGRRFSARDRDNDNYVDNCAVMYAGGWWYNQCYASNLTALWSSSNFYWGPLGSASPLDFAEMKLREQL